MEKYRNTWAEVDLDAISHNVRTLKAWLPDGAKMMGVVKADGYGHGSVEIAKVLLEQGVDFLMVALLEEAVTLRDAGIETPILVIGRVHPEYTVIAAEKNITLTVFQKAWLEQTAKLHLPQPLNLHMEFETGMNRTGVCTVEEMRELVHIIEKEDQFCLTGAYTHFAEADEIESSLYYEQKNRYRQMLSALQEIYHGSLMTHIGNSAAGIQYPEDMLAYTRFGVSLYGMYPSGAVKALENVELKQAMALYSELVQVKQVKKGDVISYGGTYEAKADEWVGTVPIGYADGWRRKLQDFYVLVNGKKCPIVGRICMDSMMIKLDQAYEPGKRVTLIGEDNGAFISMDDVANHLDTICYEIPTMLTARIPRLYQ